MTEFQEFIEIDMTRFGGGEDGNIFELQVSEACDLAIQIVNDIPDALAMMVAKGICETLSFDMVRGDFCETVTSAGLVNSSTTLAYVRDAIANSEGGIAARFRAANVRDLPKGYPRTLYTNSYDQVRAEDDFEHGQWCSSTSTAPRKSRTKTPPPLPQPAPEAEAE
jgi:hypothetical protein